MQAKVFPAFIETRHGGRCVVSHERSFGRYQKVQNLEHYLEVSIKKQGAFAGSTPLRAVARAGEGGPGATANYGKYTKSGTASTKVPAP